MLEAMVARLRDALGAELLTLLPRLGEALHLRALLTRLGKMLPAAATATVHLERRTAASAA
ncbi:hypothetical protein GCM10022276_18520 [Sphingomonas limnosediminicola]|uniref:Uncharacterized protein n=1 Tax=Sphingomonas limnosediminicola TaxID=940133 RepID=A0ABP7LHV4_9SPHN